MCRQEAVEEAVDCERGKEEASTSQAGGHVKRPEEDRFPWRGVAILLTCNLAEPIVMAMVFPVAPYMVSDWVPTDEVGSWAGLLTSAYNLCSSMRPAASLRVSHSSCSHRAVSTLALLAVPANVFWGRLSDRVGRRPCMWVILCGSAVSTIVFGFSTTLEHALLARCMGGLFSGIGGVVMAGLRDITTVNQRTVAVASIAWAYGVGFFLGPVIGGMLSRPAERLPVLRGTVLDAFPYLLPCLVVGIIIILAGTGLFWLPPPPVVETPASSKASRGVETTTSTNSAAAATSAATTIAPAEGDGRRLLASGIVSSSAALSIDSSLEPASGRALRGRRSSALSACWRCATRPIVVFLLAYLLVNFGATGAMEAYPLLVSRNDSNGLGFHSDELGLSMVPQSITVMLMPFIYPLLTRRVGQKGALYVGITALAVTALCLPMLRHFERRSPMQWVGLCSLSALRGTCGPLIFPAMLILMNGVITEHVGFWNGLASSVAASARAVSPTAFGTLFALGTAAGHAPFPLNVYMPFLLAIVSNLGAALLVATVKTQTAEGEQSPRFASRTRPWTRRRW